MALKKDKDLKLYYTISEVAEMFGIAESALRFWEKEFPQITPEKNARGVRRYNKENIEQIRIIHHLVKEKGMTIAGARETMKHGNSIDIATQHTDVIDRLIKVRNTLQELNRHLGELT